MLKVARGGGDSSPMAAGMSAQRRRSRKSASASDSLASLATTTITTTNSAKSSSSSARKTQSSKHHHHHHSTPSSLERIVTDSTTTPIISAEESHTAAAATPSLALTSSNNKKSANKAKHSSKKRSTSSITSSLSSLVMTPSADKQINGTNIDDTSSSPQKKSHKKKRQMSPRSKSKLDSLVMQQQQQQEEGKDDSDEKDKENPLENSQQQQQQKEEELIVEGSIVMVAPRTWPGMNKLGGVGRVTAVHLSTSYDLNSQQNIDDNKEEGGGGGSENNSIIDASTTTTYDVSYVLGGKDKNIEAEYVSLHDTNQDAPRERQQRNISSLSMSETNDQDVVTSKKKKSVKKKKRKRVESSLMTTSSIEASPTKTSVDSNRANLISRGKRLRQLKKVKEQQMTAAAEVAEDEKEIKATTSLKSPAFSLSSQFSNQEESLSPLDYLADSYPKLDTPVLKEYSDKWGDDDEQEVQKEVGEEEEERDDDPSSSVVSTDDEGRTFTPPKRIRRKRSSPAKYYNRDDVMSPPTENKSLEREYGRLALKKQEIERKMKIYKSDAEKINPWAKEAMGSDNGDEGRNSSLLFAHSSSQSEGLSRFRDDERSNYQARPSGDKPTREEIEFGELVYQRNLTNRRMAELKDGYPKQRSSRPKKKRRRRVVETITRVIHEESEDDASSISDRHLLPSGSGRYVHDYHDQPHHYRSTSSSRYLTDGRHSGSSEAYQGRDHYADDNIHEPRKRRYSEQVAASGSGSRKTKKSRSTSMLEDLD